MKRLSVLFSIVMLGMASFAQQSIDLAGTWKFSVGETANFDDTVTLPGSMLTNGKGNDVSVSTRWTGSLYDSSYYFNPYMAKYRVEGSMKFPFFLTPDKHYVGKAWYMRTVNVPKSWKKQRVILYLERPHIETTVYVNDQEAGRQMSLSAPHQYDVTRFIKPGKLNKIAICVYNGIENVCVGQDSHSVTDQTQGNWNGIVGRIELRTASQPIIRISHDASRRKAFITIDGESHEVSLGESVRWWSEADPYLYTRTVEHKGQPVTVTFGIRDITIKDRQIYLNGKPIWLRGTVENCCFPETGYAPMDVESWLRVLGKVKEYGLNHIRFHSYCPPEAAFVAADQLGVYLQPEGPSWPNHGVKLRRGQAIDQYLLEESKRIIDAYGHHPSFVMMAAGNEPAGDWVPYCNDWVKEMKLYDPSKIYCGASVGGGWAWDDGSEYHVKGGARGLDWDRHAPQSDDDYYGQIEFPRNYKGKVANNSPVIAHEQGQWCAFPDFREIPQYTGAYKARNFEIFRDLLRDNGMESQAEKFLQASGRLQTLAYKYEIERNLRTKDYSGFQLLALNDYSGQGTALEGVLNVHWQEKGYTDASQWREFCSPVVALARFPKFVYASSDTLVIPVEAYNALPADIAEASATYSISSDGRVLAEGRLASGVLPVGKNHKLGTVCFPLCSVSEPSKLTLTVRIAGDYRNHWDFWVYPEGKEVNSEGVYISDTLDAKTLDVLRSGGKVLLTAAGKVRLGSDVVQHYLPVFWNTSWFKMRPPHTTGAYIDKTHPLFRHGFPTDDWTNLNWWELLNRAQVMNLMELPKSYQSPVQPIDTWHISRKLGMIVEANVLGGKLLMTTMDIDTDLDHRLVARQMRRAVISYMSSDDFQPAVTLEPQVIEDFFVKEGPKVSMFTKESPDELKPKIF
ncbi:MAG: beta-glucuronidase [Prevotella ruminicola]|uniref:beta-galactosidase n=1 Tax=Xylanibacter ruminicola TaxID=839 RepID=A0A9D5PAC8_XYLRU|nr:beta-glucuronidase [Xylanibacter ruminicola]